MYTPSDFPQCRMVCRGYPVLDGVCGTEGPFQYQLTRILQMLPTTRSRWWFQPFVTIMSLCIFVSTFLEYSHVDRYFCILPFQNGTLRKETLKRCCSLDHLPNMCRKLVPRRSLQDLDSSTYRLLRSMPMMNLHGLYLAHTLTRTHRDFKTQNINRLTVFCSQEQYHEKQEPAVVCKVDTLGGLM